MLSLCGFLVLGEMALCDMLLALWLCRVSDSEGLDCFRKSYQLPTRIVLEEATYGTESGSGFLSVRRPSSSSGSEAKLTVSCLGACTSPWCMSVTQAAPAVE